MAMNNVYESDTFSTDYNTGSKPLPPKRSDLDIRNSETVQNHNTTSKPVPPKRSDIDYGNSGTMQNSTSVQNSRFFKSILVMITILLLLALGVSTACMVFILQMKQEQATSAMTQTTSDNTLKALHYQEAEVAANSVQEAKKDVAKVQEIFINRTANILNQTEELSTKVKLITSLLAPSSCRNTRKEFAKATNDTGGIFSIISPLIEGPTEVYCDMVTDAGGWIVFQRRMDGSVDFNRNWSDYVNGFGDKQREFWLGLEIIHQFTKFGTYDLRIEMSRDGNSPTVGTFSSFSVGDRSTNYRLSVSSTFTGSGSHNFYASNGIGFSTNDNDNDGQLTNCAEEKAGGWWYNHNGPVCGYTHLNSKYGQIRWSNNDMHFIEMKFRKRI